MEKSEENSPKFAFRQKLGIAQHFYGNVPDISNIIAKLLYCMQETNKFHGVSCEFFRLDFRPVNFEEQYQFPIGSFVLDLRFGSKKEAENISYCATCKNPKFACTC